MAAQPQESSDMVDLSAGSVAAHALQLFIPIRPDRATWALYSRDFAVDRYHFLVAAVLG